MTLAEESALISLAASGDEDAFGEIYRDNNKKVLAILLKLTHNLEDAEDLMSDTFISVFKSLSTFRGEAKISTWIHRIAVNKFMMVARQKKKVFIPLSEDLKLYIPENAYRRIQLSEVIDKIVDLPSKGRKLMLLRTVYGLTNDETCKVLGIQPTTSRARLHRIRKRIKQSFVN